MNLLTNTAKTASQTLASYIHSDGSNTTRVAIQSGSYLHQQKENSASFVMEQRSVELMSDAVNAQPIGVNEDNEKGENMCYFCENNFPSLYRLKTHLKKVHREKECYNCAEFEKEGSKSHFLKKYGIPKHHLECGHMSMYQCINCNLIFVSESLYEMHNNSTVQHRDVMKNLRTNKDKTAIQASSDFTCSDGLNDTGVAIASTSSIASASSMHPPKLNSDLFFLKQGNIEEEASCLGANKDNVLFFEDRTSKCFESVKDNIDVQQRCVNEENKKLECNACQVVLYGETNLNRHMIKNHESPTKKRRKRGSLRCTKCDISFTSVGSLNVHFNKVHDDKSSWEKCPVCGLCFAQLSNLKRHMSFLHTDKDFTQCCSLCKKVFANHHSLKRHMSVVHTDEDFTQCCSLCKKVFSNRYTLKTHWESMHSTKHDKKREKPYKCVECKSGFADKSHYRRHTRTKKHQERLQSASNFS